MEDNLIKLLIKEIKTKNQIKDLEDNYILNKLNKYFLTNGNLKNKIESEFKIKKNKITKSKTFKEIIKAIRDEIGIVYGSFLTKNFKKKEKILNEINELNDENILELLKIHKSTRERIDSYKLIYSKIFQWYKPDTILDIASGMNPISIYYMKKELNYYPKYYAIDLNPNDMKFLNKFFKKFNINGFAMNYDVTELKIFDYNNNDNNNNKFQEADLIFLFKAIDSFEQIKKNISKELILKLKANHIVISFPTKSIISKKEFKIEKRNWLFNFLKKKSFEYKIFETENELFILINKKN